MADRIYSTKELMKIISAGGVPPEEASNRAEHFSWGSSDLEHHGPAHDRSGHLSWGPNDLHHHHEHKKDESKKDRSDHWNWKPEHLQHHKK